MIYNSNNIMKTTGLNENELSGRKHQNCLTGVQENGSGELILSTITCHTLSEVQKGLMNMI